MIAGRMRRVGSWLSRSLTSVSPSAPARKGIGNEFARSKKKKKKKKKKKAPRYRAQHMTLVLRDVADGIGAITLNRPEQMNSLTVALSGELERAILELGSNPGVNVVVIQGAGGNFCAGGDFSEVELCDRDGRDG